MNETTKDGFDGGSAGGTIVEVMSATDGAIAIEDGAWVTGAAFDRQGFDLLIEGDNGESILVHDYFAQAEPADLSLDGGEAVLRGAIVERLAGPAADGQVAQNGANDGGVIGNVQDVTGDGWAIRVDGTRVDLQEGSDIYLGDVLETSSDGLLAVNFVDGTSFSLAEDARMVIDQLVYDPDSSSNVASFSLVQGLFVMVSGDVSKTGDMTIETPVSTIGIRGTSVAIQAAAEGLQNLITLLQDPDGTIGVVEVATAVARVILDTLGATTSVTTANQAPSAIEILQGVDIEALYSAALAPMQTARDSALGLGTSATGDDAGPGDVGDPAEEGESAPASEEGESAPASEEDLSEYIGAIKDLFAALADAVDDGDAEVDEEDDVDEDEVDEDEVDELTESVVVEESHSRKVLRRIDEPKETEETTAQTDVTTVEVTTADNNDVYLRGAFSELGIADNGTMGTTSVMPDNFAANTHTPRSSVSFYANASGIDDGTPIAGDIFLPGGPVESMSLGFTDGTGFFRDANQNDGDENSLNMAFGSITTTATSASVVNTGGIA
ncbi:MAG: FecR family protein, partial [Alphaproteobacteria bacterium]